MAKSDFSTLQSRVSGLVANGVTLSANTTPTLTNVKQWINDAQSDIARDVPSPFLDELLTDINPSIAAVSEYAINVTDYLRFHSATLNVDGASIDYPMLLVSPKKATWLLRSSFYGVASSPILWFEGTKAKWQPATTGPAATGKFILIYVKIPTALSGDADTSDLDEVWEDAIVSRACAKHFLNEEDINMYRQYQTEYIAKIKQISGLWGY